MLTALLQIRLRSCSLKELRPYPDIREATRTTPLCYAPRTILDCSPPPDAYQSGDTKVPQGTMPTKHTGDIKAPGGVPRLVQLAFHPDKAEQCTELKHKAANRKTT